MDFLRRVKSGVSLSALSAAHKLPPFHPSTPVCEWGSAGTLTIETCLRHQLILGATGSGKSSGPARSLAYGYLRAGFGILALCAKPDEAETWRKWCAETNRTHDIIEINEKGDRCFNFLADEASRPGAGSGLTLNTTSLLTEVAGSMGKSGGKSSDEGGGDKFWVDSLAYALTNIIDALILSGQAVTLPHLREIISSAPLTMEQAGNESFRKNSACCRAVVEAIKRAGDDPLKRVNVKEVASFLLQGWPSLSEKTRSIIQLQIDMLIRPFLTHPLYKIFSTETNFRPEDTFNGAVIIVNLPAQIYKNIGVSAGVLMKYLTQLAILRRSPPKDGTYLRPVVIFSDEAQTFISDFDYVFNAVARSAGGISTCIVQNLNSLIARIGDEHKVFSLTANMQTVVLCQNTSVRTNEWASELLGKRWDDIASMSVNRTAQDINQNSSVNITEQLRAYCESSRFATLKRGGAPYYLVEAIVFKGGELFSDGMPFQLVSFDQR